MIGMIGLILFMALLWRQILISLTKKRFHLGPIFRIHLLSWLGRYAPGKIGLLLGKLLLGSKLGLSKTVIVSSVIYEHLFFISSGLSVVLIFLGPDAISRLAPLELSPIAIMILILGIIISIPFFIKAGFGLIRKIMKRYGNSQNVSVPMYKAIGFFAGYHITHLSAGLGFYVLINALVPDHGIGILDAIGILAAAHLSGILVFFVPAGLGVRESVMTLLLVPYMGVETALSISILARIWSMTADASLLLVLPLFGIKNRT